jgi:alkaline phosphatase
LAEFAVHTGGPREHHYSFDLAGVHFVVLDACYRSDGADYQRKNFDWTDANIPAQQVDWLLADLAKTSNPTVILAHQLIDESGKHMVRNAAAVRAELERSGKVLAVFQGHSHRNDYQQIAGIHYTTLVAMIEGSGLENSGYAVLEVMRDRSIRLRGFRQQMNRELRRA